MCSNKSIVDFRRDSFSGRVCDDLCRELLQYLSLEDRLRLECVSKHFQRNIYVSQKSLKIDFNDMNKSGWLNYMVKGFKMCRNIHEIVTSDSSIISFTKREDIHELHNTYNKFFEMIVKYCDNLTHFHVFLQFMSEENRQKFSQKFGSKLKSIDFQFCNSEEVPKFLSLLDVTKINDLSVLDITSELSQIKFKSLKSFNFKNVKDSDVVHFETFLGLNGSALKYLDINCNDVQTSYDNILRSVSKLKNLIHLSIKSSYGMNDKRYDNHWTRIAQSCKQLKSLEIDYNFVMIKGWTVGQHLMPLRQFHELKRLTIRYNTFASKADSEVFREFYSFRVFHGFRLLTSLDVTLPETPQRPLLYPEILLTGIDTNHKLQSLRIGGHFHYSEWAADILSRLSKLESIHLWISDEMIRPVMETKLKNNCKLISKIDLEFKVDFSWPTN